MQSVTNNSKKQEKENMLLIKQTSDIEFIKAPQSADAVFKLVD